MEEARADVSAEEAEAVREAGSGNVSAAEIGVAIGAILSINRRHIAAALAQRVQVHHMENTMAAEVLGSGTEDNCWILTQQ